MGVTLIWPLALTLLAGGIIVMYLLKQHAEEFKVPSLFLWTEIYKNQTADKPWEKLKKNILMVLEILTLLVLILALMGPYIKAGKGKGSTVMIVIDTSASMEADFKNSESRLATAKKDAENLVKNLPADTLVSVITSNTEANVLLSATSDHLAAIAAIKGVKQTERAGSCEAGLKTARALYNAYEDAAVVIFTDTYLATSGMNASIYDYSGDINNAAVSFVFSEDNGDDTFTVVAGITNYGKKELVTAVDLYEVYQNGDRKMLASKEITLAAGDEAKVDFSDVSLTGQGIAVGIGAEDDLESDNIFYSYRQMKKDAEILLYSKGENTFLKTAIKLVDGVNITKTDTTAGFAEKTGYTLYIFDCLDGIKLEELPKDGNLLLIGCKTELDTGTKNTIMLSAKNDFGDYEIPVNKTYTYLQPANGRTLFKTEDGEVAGYIDEKDGRKICLIGFDFHASDFPLTVNFPIFIYDLIKELTDTCPVDRVDITPGESVRVSLNGMVKSSIVRPDGKAITVEATDRYTDTEMPGCYFVKGGTAEEDTVFAVNLDSSESNVGKMQSDSEEGVEIKSGSGTSTMNLRTIIIALALVLLVVEWIIYIRQ